MRFDVLYQADENYAVFGGISITSLFENNKAADEIVVHFLASGFDGNIKNKLRELEQRYNRKIIIYDAEKLRKRIMDIGATIHDGSYATYYKLFLQEFIPEEVNRILYVDDDTLILGDLSRLFEMDMGDSPLAITKDSDPLPFINQTEEERLRCRYNCGVMLIDMCNWRNNNCQHDIEEYMRNNNNYWHDQDILNRMYYEQIIALPCEYNVQPLLYKFKTSQYFNVFHQRDYYSREEVEYAKNNVIIAHFFHWCGESAWNKGTLHPYRKLFRQYLQISPWKDSYVPVRKKFDLRDKHQRLLIIEKIAYIVLPKGLFLKLWHETRRKVGLALIQD